MQTLPNQSERGAALMVALVILFMITILGVSAMQSANVETRLSGNALVKETTFQSAESAVDSVKKIPNVFSDIICAPNPSITDMTNLNRTSNQVTKASVEYGGMTTAPGFSIGGNFAVHRFYVTGTSTLDDLNTSTTIATGHTIVGAANNGANC